MSARGQQPGADAGLHGCGARRRLPRQPRRASFTLRLVSAGSVALQLVGVSVGLSAAGCCRLLPGSATAATQRTDYRPGDIVIVALRNRSNEERRRPSLGERSSLERYSDGRWLPVPVRDPAIEPFLMPGEEGPQVILPVLKTVEPCSEAESQFALPRSLPAGHYRIRIPESWTTNSFQVGPRLPSAGAVGPP